MCNQWFWQYGETSNWSCFYRNPSNGTKALWRIFNQRTKVKMCCLELERRNQLQFLGKEQLDSASFYGRSYARCFCAIS